MILQLQIKVFMSKDFAIPGNGTFGAFVVVIQKCARNLARDAGRSGDEPVTVLGEHFFVDTGCVIMAFQLRNRGEFKQVLVAGFVFGKQNEVGSVTVFLGVFVLHPAGCQVGFQPNNGFYAGIFSRAIEIQRAKHGAMIG